MRRTLLIAAASAIAFPCESLSMAQQAQNQSCACFACDTTGGRKNAITLFTQGKQDGVGSVGTDIVGAAAIAARLGWRFGGAIGSHGKAQRVHGTLFDPVFDMLFGNSDSVSPHAAPTEISLMPVNLNSVNGGVRPWTKGPLSDAILQKYTGFLSPGFEGYFWLDQVYEPSQSNMDFFFTPDFRRELRRGASCGIRSELQKRNKPSGGGLRIVAHLRRGDADFEGQRYVHELHDSWYFGIVDAMKNMVPNSTAVAFTSCFKEEQCRELRSKEVSKWKMHGIDLRVDSERSGDSATDDFMSSFAEMASADVLVMAKSGFSHLAALFNPNCMIHNPNDYHNSLSSWIEVGDPPIRDRLETMDWFSYAGEYDVSKLHVTNGAKVSAHSSNEDFGEQLRAAMAGCLSPAKLQEKQLSAASASLQPYGAGEPGINARLPADKVTATVARVTPLAKMDEMAKKLENAERARNSMQAAVDVSSAEKKADVDSVQAGKLAVIDPARVREVLPPSNILIAGAAGPFDQNGLCGTCHVCNISGRPPSDKTVVTLYTRGKGDGAGSAVLDMIFAAAIASKLGFRFGGATAGSHGKALGVHGPAAPSMFDEVFDMILGNHSLVAWGENPPEDTTSVDLNEINLGVRPWSDKSKLLTNEYFQKYASMLPVAQAYHWKDVIYDPAPANTDILLNASFLEHLRKGAECGIIENSGHPPSTSRHPRSLRVVAHYRRGDADRESNRAVLVLHSSFYFGIAQALKDHFVNISFLAFTSCNREEQCAELSAKEVPLWQSHGFQLRVDDERNETAAADWKSAFAQMATADIFIMGKSSLSHVAALLNPNCVFRNVGDIKHAPLASWVEIDDHVQKGVPRKGNHLDWLMFKGVYNTSNIRVESEDASQPLIEQLLSATQACLPAEGIFLVKSRSKSKSPPLYGENYAKQKRLKLPSSARAEGSSAALTANDHCSCRLCQKALQSGQSMASRAISEGPGAMCINIIFAAAIAHRLGWHFEGAVGFDFTKATELGSPHSAALLVSVLDMVFGNHTAIAPLSLRLPQKDVSFVHLGKVNGGTRPWSDPTRNLSAASLRSWEGSLGASKRYFLGDAVFEPASTANVDFLLTDAFLAILRRGASCGARKVLVGHLAMRNRETSLSASEDSAATRLKVVASYHHVIRGSKEKGAKGPSHSSSWILPVMQALKYLSPTAELLAFASCNNDNHCRELQSLEVPEWRRSGVELRVADERNRNAIDEMDIAMAHMVTADVFLLAKASLSHAAAIINPNCIIYSTSDVKHQPRSSWIQVENVAGSVQVRGSVPFAGFKSNLTQHLDALTARCLPGSQRDL